MRSIQMVQLLALAAIGCAAKSAAPPAPTTLSGTAALSSFPKAPTVATATDETGRTVNATLANDGRFAMPLPKGHTYRLTFATTSSAIPLVFPRQTGKLDASFVLKTDGAAVRLGTVRYLAGAPAAGFKVLATKATQGSQQGGDCVDCVNDDQKTTCESGEAGGANGEAPDSAEQADPTGEVAVGDQNAPDQVDGCGGAQDGDNLEQAGEN